MHVLALEIDGVFEITPLRHADDRGSLTETWNRKSLTEFGLNLDFVQDNQVYSEAAGTLRGLHFQIPPRAQAKLVRVLSGTIFDVAVDIRRGSPWFGCWIGVELSCEKGNQLLVPVGFAHGYVTLAPKTEVAYKVTDYYSPEHDRSIRCDDPALGIAWPRELSPFRTSKKDSGAPLLADIDTGFVYR